MENKQKPLLLQAEEQAHDFVKIMDERLREKDGIGMSDAAFAEGRELIKRHIVSLIPFDLTRFTKSPCYICGYNGPGYFQTETHPCAKQYHELREAGNRAAKKINSGLPLFDPAAHTHLVDMFREIDKEEKKLIPFAELGKHIYHYFKSGNNVKPDLVTIRYKDVAELVEAIGEKN